MARYPDRACSRLVLIGTSDYERSNELDNLPAVHNNLTGLEAALTDPDIGVFAAENCRVVDSPDSPQSLIRRLRQAAAEAEDVLMIYYAGHGLLGWKGALHLAVRETDPNQTAGTAVPYSWVSEALQDSPARIRILLLDCCFSGRAIGAMSGDSAALEQVDVAGSYVLTSTTANQVSHAVPGERYTAFTAELIKLLSGSANPADEPLTLEGLYRPLKAAMARRGLPSPKASVVDTGSDLILRRSQEASPPEAPSTTVPPSDMSSARPVTPAPDQPISGLPMPPASSPRVSPVAQPESAPPISAPSVVQPQSVPPLFAPPSKPPVSVSPAPPGWSAPSAWQRPPTRPVPAVRPVVRPFPPWRLILHAALWLLTAVFFALAGFEAVGVAVSHESVGVSILANLCFSIPSLGLLVAAVLDARWLVRKRRRFWYGSPTGDRATRQVS